MAMFNDATDFSALNFPTTALSSFPEDDFFALLQGHAKPAAPDAAAATVGPTNLSSLPNPTTISPPTSASDSSPSPPNFAQDPFASFNLASSSTDPAATAAQSLMNTRSTRSSVRDAIDILGKRKAPIDMDEDDDEDDDDEDSHVHKAQHTDAPGSSKKSSRRKSGSTQDEYRLQKRKEQNRAAQRAFRERKEKHVKDLEDRVSMLEAKTDSQAAENENLRELLTRLQTENIHLKQSQAQSQFNFTFQPATQAPSFSSASSNSANAAQAPSQQSSQSPSEPALTNNATPPSAQKSTPDIHLFDAFPLSGDGLSGFGLTPPPTTGSTSGASPGSDFSFLNMFGSFSNANTNGVSPSNPFNGTGMPYQTIASNPMFTSFREPTPNAWASFGPNLNGDVSMSAYDELFGGGGAAGAQSLPSSAVDASVEDLLSFNAFLPDLANNISPISHQNVSPPAMNGPSAGNHSASASSSSINLGNSHASTSGSSSARDSPNSSVASTNNSLVHQDGVECPKTKGDLAAIIEKEPQRTFGPPMESPDVTMGLPEGFAEGYRCTIAPADRSKVNLDLGTAWKAVRQHPQFEDCDIDALCAELAQKARCDGTSKVVEAQSIMDLVHSIPDRAAARRNKKTA